MSRNTMVSTTRTYSRYLTILLLVTASCRTGPAAVLTRGQQTLQSPDGKITVTCDLRHLDSRTGCPTYSVRYGDGLIVADSRLGLAVKDGPDLGSNFEIVSVERDESDTTYRPVYGQWKTIRDNYGQLTIGLRQKTDPGRRMDLIFRAYNEGVAFCYRVPRQPGPDALVIAAENSQFRFAGDHTAHAVYSAQGQYSKVPLSKLRKNCERPLTIEIADGPFVSIAEARLVDYARMRLSPVPGEKLTLVSSLAGQVSVRLALQTPWRIILVGDTPGQLMERSYLILNLNESCAIADTSWIKPGKVIREVTLTTVGGKACVDFAVEHNLQYVEFDAGWYGHEYDDSADATTISVDPKRSKGPLDLHEVIRYANQRGIGILVYVNRRALEKQLDDILPLYRSWGIKGVKYGFVQVGSQQWTRWLHEAVRKAAANQLMVDVHDEYRPTGYSRTYPNLMTQEGIRGNECMPTADENLVLPFTRMLAGAADYTVCYYNNRIKTTHAHQLAASVVFYSPWQFLFWYDRPAAFQGEPEIEFFEHVPTVWDDLKVVDGQIGKFMVVARKAGAEWFVGTMNGREARDVKIPLQFLDKGTTYVAHLFFDDPQGSGTRTGVGIVRHLVNSATVIDAKLLPSGGHAMRIVPAEADEVGKYSEY